MSFNSAPSYRGNRAQMPNRSISLSESDNKHSFPHLCSFDASKMQNFAQANKCKNLPRLRRAKAIYPFILIEYFNERITASSDSKRTLLARGGTCPPIRKLWWQNMFGPTPPKDMPLNSAPSQCGSSAQTPYRPISLSESENKHSFPHFWTFDANKAQNFARLRRAKVKISRAFGA